MATGVIRYHGPTPNAGWVGERSYLMTGPSEARTKKWYEILGYRKDDSWWSAWFLDVRWIDSPE